MIRISTLRFPRVISHGTAPSRPQASCGSKSTETALNVTPKRMFNDDGVDAATGPASPVSSRALVKGGKSQEVKNTTK